MLSPLDSVRYFEFDFFGESLKQRENLGKYLDVSSPRLLSWTLLQQMNFESALLINPDLQDLGVTARLFKASNLDSQKIITLMGKKLEDLDNEDEYFDTIVCMSVLEHIPINAAIEALRNMWRLLKRGGQLLLSVPCSRIGFEEFININEYGLSKADEKGYVFGQRFYDQEMLKNQIYDITGMPEKVSIFGEIKLNSFFENRRQKLTNLSYPFWKEAYMVSKEYQNFQKLDDMPGLGVIAFEFNKA